MNKIKRQAVFRLINRSRSVFYVLGCVFSLFMADAVLSAQDRFFRLDTDFKNKPEIKYYELTGTVLETSYIPNAGNAIQPDCYYTAIVHVDEAADGVPVSNIVVFIKCYERFKNIPDSAVGRGDQIVMRCIDYNQADDATKKTLASDQLNHGGMKKYFVQTLQINRRESQNVSSSIPSLAGVQAANQDKILQDADRKISASLAASANPPSTSYQERQLPGDRIASSDLQPSEDVLRRQDQEFKQKVTSTLSIPDLVTTSDKQRKEDKELNDKLSNIIAKADETIEQRRQALANGYLRKDDKDSGTFVMDSENVMQYWIDDCVFRHNGKILIELSPVAEIDTDSEKKEEDDDDEEKQQFECSFLKLKIPELNRKKDFTVSVSFATPGVQYQLFDRFHKLFYTSPVSNGSQTELPTFLLHSSEFAGSELFFKFTSSEVDTVNINKITIDYQSNPDFIYRKLFYVASDQFDSKLISANTFAYTYSATGKRTMLIAKGKIVVPEKESAIKMSVKVRNTGKNPTRIYVGYKYFDKDRTHISSGSFPAKGTNSIVNVVSSKAGSNTLIVDAMPKYSKGNCIALNARTDLSDVPNLSLLDGNISAVKELPDGKAEITMSLPIKTAVPKGTPVRIHQGAGMFLYMNDQILQPGEEKVFTSSISKDESSHLYTSDSIATGVYYVSPLILSYSTDANLDNTVKISDWVLTY